MRVQQDILNRLEEIIDDMKLLNAEESQAKATIDLIISKRQDLNEEKRELIELLTDSVNYNQTEDENRSL